MHGIPLYWALTFITAGMLTWLEKYIFNDWEFLTFLSILIVGDTVLGFYLAVRRNSIDAKAWGQIIDKLVTYFSLVIVCHILADFTIDGEKVHYFLYAKHLGYSALIVRESISILQNLGHIRPNLVPLWLLKRLKYFEKTGKT